jgi:hypothetical protein
LCRAEVTRLLPEQDRIEYVFGVDGPAGYNAAQPRAESSLE